MRTYVKDINADFTCKNCGCFVSARSEVSGVVNRNHCPYCLYSRHVDLFTAGDRLCACKGLMAPIGLALKNSRDKYAKRNPGELMLVHCCEHCDRLSINRIAADDDTVKILAVLGNNSEVGPSFLERCWYEGIHPLRESHRTLVQTQLFGSAALMASHARAY